MKELEAQIAGLDFDIGQEKQRNYTYLSPESVEKYLNSIICGDIQEMPVRKLIVKAFVREVILDNDNVTITYNFTENYTKYRVTQEIIQKVQRQSRKKTAYNKNLCSYKLPPLPPEKPALSERVLLFARDGILYLSLTRLAQRRNNRCSVASLLTNPTASERKPACSAGFQWLFQNAIPHRPFTLLSASGR